jgi:hypothetical protein
VYRERAGCVAKQIHRQHAFHLPPNVDKYRLGRDRHHPAFERFTTSTPMLLLFEFRQNIGE